MKKFQIKIILSKIHFLLLGAGILNWISKKSIEFSLNYQLAYVIIILIFSSGFALFLWNLRPFKSIGIYYGYYFMTPILTLLFWLFGGIILALINAAVLYPIYPNRMVSEYQNFTVYQKFQGFMGPCCPYEITETHYWLIEKKLTDVDFHHDTYIHSVGYDKNDNTELKISYDKYNFQADNFRQTDTIIQLNRK